MSWDRVIQDSDDEDELAADILPPPKPVQQAPVRTDATEDESAGANQQIAINFDEFLQSQEAAQTRLSSSQQRREERWIPMSGDGRSESIGMMMTEIGLAQRRLLDEEDSNQQQGPRTVSAPISHLEPLVPVTDAQTMYQDDNGVYYSNYGHGHTEPSHEQPDVNYHSTVQYTNGHDYHGYAETAQPDPHIQQQPSTFSSSYSGPSDNLFESSLRPTTSYSNQTTNPFTNHHTTTDTELLHISSPHDTEPNSFIVRARADTATELQPPPPPPQGSIDELPAPAPITVEIPQPPVPEKKRGRPKKQSLPDTDGEDELAQPRTTTTTTTTTTPVQPEKRRPGRPPKSAKKDVEGPPPTDVHNQPEILLPLPSDLTNGDSVVLPEDRQPQTETTTEAVDKATPNPTIKALKKKKVKRSKTTSVTLKKSYESDVEDDVIWIDERPATNAPLDENGSLKADTTKPPLLEKHDTNDNTIDQSMQPDAAPAPKKRGRKRKKTVEEPVAIEAAPVEQAQTQDPEPESIPEPEPTSPPKDLEQNPTTEDNNPPTIPDQAPEQEEIQQPPTTPQKGQLQPHTPEAASSSKGAAKQHSPISTTSKVPYRVGLSKKARIAPLLKIVRR